MMEAILFILVLAVFYVYIGYPALIWLIAATAPRRIAKAEFYPAISIVIAAHNEEESIGRTISNKMELDYPAEKVEVIVVSDASADGTDEIVKGFADKGVRLIRQEARGGKTAALNRGVNEASGELIVFSDANSIYQKNALKELAFNFADSRVGYVTGRMEYIAAEDSHVGGGSDSYMKYENKLRELETAVGSIVGVDGGIDAVRKSLYSPMDSSLLPDFVLPLNVVEKGFRVVYEPGAMLNEEALEETTDEYQMRVRVALRAFHALWHKKGLFNPFRHGIFALQLFSHKLLRYLVGFIFVAILLCSIAVQKPWANAFVWVQIACYLFALIGFWQNRTRRILRVFKYPFYLCLINFASAIAFLKFLSGEKQVTWKPRQG